MTKKTLTRRAKQAASIEKKALAIWRSLGKLPSFKGQCPLMDRLHNVYIHAHNLRFNLNADAGKYEDT